jgi:hypothetical protein
MAVSIEETARTVPLDLLRPKTEYESAKRDFRCNPVSVRMR